MLRPIATFVLLAACVLPRPGAAGPPPSFYTVSHTVQGVRLTLHFASRSYPRHALIAVTATIRNLSHRHLAVARSFGPFGLCSWPAVSLIAVNARGQNAQPASPIPFPNPKCAAAIPRALPIGLSVVEHQMIVLWSSRLRVSAQLFNVVHHCDCGFSLNMPDVRLHLSSAPAPRIRVKHAHQSPIAVVTLPAAAAGLPLYYRSWGTCGRSWLPSIATYWTKLHGRAIPSQCHRFMAWHVDVAALNQPVASMDLKGGRIIGERIRVHQAEAAVPGSGRRLRGHRG